MYGVDTCSGGSGNPQPYKDRRKPVLSFCVHNPYKSAHFPLNIPNVQVEVSTLPMIQFIQGYFALK
jgi:hypothetical protein